MVIAAFLRQAWHQFSTRIRPRSEDRSEVEEASCTVAHVVNGAPPSLSFSTTAPPSKKQRLSAANAAESYVKGRSSWTSSRHLLGRRRPNARTNRRLPPAVFPSPSASLLRTPHSPHPPPSQIPNSPILSLLSQTEEPPASRPPPPLVVDLTEEEAVEEDPDDVVILSPRPTVFISSPDRHSLKAPPAQPVIVDVEMESGDGGSALTPIKDLLRSPLHSPTAKESGRRKEPAMHSVASPSSVDLEERERFQRVLSAQRSFQPKPSTSQTTTNNRQLLAERGLLERREEESEGLRGRAEAAEGRTQWKRRSSAQESLSDLRRVLEELCPEDEADAGVEAETAKAKTPPASSSLPPPALGLEVELPEGLDLDPSSLTADLRLWREGRQSSAVDVANLEAELRLLRDLRIRKDRLAEKKLRDRLRLQGIAIPDVPFSLDDISDEEEAEPAKEILPELPSDADSRIAAALASPDSETLVNIDSVPVTSKDLRTLNGLNWLNDEIINAYLGLVVARSQGKVHAFNTFFLPKLMDSGYSAVRRWTRRVDVFAKEKLLVPVHLGVHWCMAVVDLAATEINYFDSMGAPNDAALEALREYLESEHSDKKKSPFDASNFALINRADIPQQKNGSDCGMFACKFADYYAAGKRISFSQEDIPYFRRRMAYEILTKNLLS